MVQRSKVARPNSANWQQDSWDQQKKVQPPLCFLPESFSRRGVRYEDPFGTLGAEPDGGRNGIFRLAGQERRGARPISCPAMPLTIQDSVHDLHDPLEPSRERPSSDV